MPPYASTAIYRSRLRLLAARTLITRSAETRSTESVVGLSDTVPFSKSSQAPQGPHLSSEEPLLHAGCSAGVPVRPGAFDGDFRNSGAGVSERSRRCFAGLQLLLHTSKASSKPWTSPSPCWDPSRSSWVARPDLSKSTVGPQVRVQNRGSTCKSPRVGRSVGTDAADAEAYQLCPLGALLPKAGRQVIGRVLLSPQCLLQAGIAQFESHR